MNRMIKNLLYVYCILGLFCMNVHASDVKQCEQLYKSKKYEEALPICQNDCDMNDGVGCFYIGGLYYRGLVVKQDYSKATK